MDTKKGKDIEKLVKILRNKVINKIVHFIELIWNKV